MIISTTNFDKDVPDASGTAFASASPPAGSTSFARDRVPEDNHVMEGDNTGATVYGGDFETFGGLYGAGNMGGLTHFLNRPELPDIDHA